MPTLNLSTSSILAVRPAVTHVWKKEGATLHRSREQGAGSREQGTLVLHGGFRKNPYPPIFLAKSVDIIV